MAAIATSTYACSDKASACDVLLCERKDLLEISTRLCDLPIALPTIRATAAHESVSSPSADARYERAWTYSLDDAF